VRLDQILTLERPLVGVDLETTGTDVRTNGIVEIALEIMVPGQEPQEYRTLINPLLRIPPEATAVHGITDAMVADAPTFRSLAANLHAGLSGCDFVGYNLMTFDLPMLEVEFERAAMRWSYEDARVLDGFRAWQVAEGRKLEDARKRWLDLEIQAEVLEFEGQAHSALYDVKVASRVVAAQVEQCDLPRDVQALHDLLWPDRYDAQGKLRWRPMGNVQTLAISFGEHRDKPLQKIPKGYLRWMLGKDFSPKVKAAVDRALNDAYHVKPL
jgi:DNA polymerase-3 subunit epsilon